MDQFGESTLFLAIAVLLGSLALYCLLRVLARPLPAALDRVVFVPMPNTTPSVYALETDEEWEEDEETEAPQSGTSS